MVSVTRDMDMDVADVVMDAACESKSEKVAGTGDADVVVKGIKLMRFTTPEWGVVNSSKYPPNANYYMNGPAGMQNMSVAQQGAPVFISKPHFLDCGPGAVREVTGLAPDRAKHDTFLDVEPSTGITMQEHKRIQINVEVQRIPLLTLKSSDAARVAAGMRKLRAALDKVKGAEGGGGGSKSKRQRA